MPGRVVLTVTEGPIKGRAFTFESHDTFIFGRGESCHARLPEADPTASRHHFMLEVNVPEARLRDLGSLNGTFVNGTKVGARAPGESPDDATRRRFPEVDLKDGDSIGVGDTLIEVRIAMPAQPAVTIPRRIACQQCGEDVTAEVPPGCSGDYVCRGCRATLEPVEASPVAASPAATVPRAARAPAKGPKVPGYEILKELGRGGMGAVYLAKRARDGATVALKVLLAKVAVNDAMRESFLRELEVTRTLVHPNIVAIVDPGASGAVFHFAMEVCQGGNLASLAERNGGRLPPEAACRLVLQATRGLAYAHESGFVHRDVKPQNILLTGPEDGAKLADFGLAKNFENAGLSGFTKTGDMGGTPLYMPCEQLTNYKRVKPATDVWSMGATLHFLLTGQPARDFPKGKDPLAIILAGEAVPLLKRDPRLPKRIAEVVDRAVATRLEDRYATGGELARALESAI